jgi:23S rRNA (cytidine1920-2'-O)/16S rRNA (cytidine1409-2'-O)-methyltransferase
VAIDVGKGQLDWTLRKDPRVTVIENMNARYLTGESIAGRLEGKRPDLAAVDVSFISLEKVLRPVLSVMGENAEMVVLVKPQFEVGKGKVGKGGIVRDPSLQKEALISVWNAAEAIGLGPTGVAASPIRGSKGNREFFFHLVSGASPFDREKSLDAAMSE